MRVYIRESGSKVDWRSMSQSEGSEGHMEKKRKWKKRLNSSPSAAAASINNLDDGCLMHIFSFLSPLPDRYNTALVCHRWCYLACHPRLWLRVDRSVKDLAEPGVYPNIETAVSAARPGDTILIAAGGSHFASNIQIKKPLCLIGGGDLPDDTTLVCLRGSDRSLEWAPGNHYTTLLTENAKFGMHSLCLSSAFEFLSTCKVANLTVTAELGCCLLHRSGRLTIDGCILQCESNPLDYLSCPIVSTATCPEVLTSAVKGHGDSVTVSRTRIEGGAKAVLTSGTLALQRVRVIYARTSLFFWFDIEQR